MNAVEIRQLSKSFGDNKAISGLDLSVPENSVFGFVGKNGAGKTTTMKMVLGLMKPTDGDIFVFGEKVVYGETKSNRYIGYLPDVPEFYGYMKPTEYLKLCGEVTGMPKDRINEKSEELLKLVGLSGANRKIAGFSRGMKQRLGIAQALMNDPRLLICDEPTSALDPIGRKEILEILSAVKGRTTVLFSTHILSDVERICDHIAILNEGKIVMSGKLTEVKKHYRQDCYLIEFSSEADTSIFVCSDELSAPYMSVKRDRNILTIKVSDIRSGGLPLIDVLSKRHITPIKFEVMEPTLESMFVEAVK